MAYDSNGGINQDFLDELKFKCDVVSIISQYVPLTKKGNKYFGNCPFHNEKTGSFCVNTSGQFYYCFGCHASGNVISFIMEMESLSFIEAVKFLAERAGMELPEYKIDPNAKKKKEHKEVLHSLTRDAAMYYRKNLLKEVEGKEAREYLESRGITEEIAKHYGIGLSLKDSGLYGYLRRKEYSDADIRECGLVSGQGHDPFDNRIMVPIIDGMGNVVAFGGRIYHGETGVGKYVNSTNTNLFDKSHFLYGANFIKKEKRENSAFREVILVEGYMDVISLGSVGIKNAVAGMGTALNAGQARELARLADTVLVCYDGDGAGRKASAKNLDTLMETGIDIKVVSLPDGKDPDEVIRGEGVDAFRGYLKAALPVIEYRLKLCEEAYDLDTYDGRQKYIRAALAALESVNDVAEKRVYLEKVASLSRVSADALIKEYGKVKTAKTVQTSEIAEEKEEKTLKAERFILNKIITDAPYVNKALFNVDWVLHPVHKSIAEYCLKSGENANFATLFDMFPGEREINKIIECGDVYESAVGGGVLKFNNVKQEEEYYLDCLVAVANEYISSRLEHVKQQYSQASSPDEKRELLIELKNLQTKLKSKNVAEKL